MASANETIAPHELASPTISTFETALGRIRAGGPYDDATSAALVLEVAHVLVDAPALSGRERDRRLRVVATTLNPSESAYRQVATGAVRLSPQAHNALRVILPAAMRKFPIQSSTGPATADTATEARIAAGPSDFSSVVDPGHIVANDEVADRQEDTLAQYAVALVGVATDHDNNRAILTQAGLKPLPVRTLEELWELAPTGLCGFVVGPSVWAMAPQQHHTELLKRLCCLSTVLFARVAVNGLASAVAAEVPDILSAARCGPVDGSRFCHGDGCQITPADIETLSKVAALLANAERTPFYPLGLSDTEARLLRVVAGAGGLAEKGAGTLRTLGAREIAGGRSSAKMYLIRPVGETRPLVIKLDSVEVLQDEIARYQRWIAPWESTVSDARLHTHLGASAIAYRLQPSADAVLEPAPTLEDRLVALRSAENWAQDEPTGARVLALEADLKIALARCVDRLADLAARSAQGAPGSPLWRHWPSINLERLGVKLDLDLGQGRRMAISTIVQAAAERVDRLHNRASTHGDIHARNILLIDRSPAFVDFAQSGPGHPCHDLACLDGAVRVHMMRMGVGEAELASVYLQLYVHGADEGALRDVLSPVFTSACSRVALATACHCRVAALRVVASYGGALEDYLAAVAATSGYLLTHVAPHSGVERALLAMIGPRLI